MEYERERDAEKKKKFILYVNRHKIPLMTKDKAFWLVYGDKGCTKFNFKSKNKKKDESDNLGKENNSRNKKEKKENKENKEEK